MQTRTLLQIKGIGREDDRGFEEHELTRERTGYWGGGEGDEGKIVEVEAEIGQGMRSLLA